jgi:hypothetical protein
MWRIIFWKIIFRSVTGCILLDRINDVLLLEKDIHRASGEMPQESN